MEKQMVRPLKTVDMTVGKPIKHILGFAIPLFIGTVFQQLYSFADIMIVGRSRGDMAIAAIGATSAIYSLLISFANGMNSGFGLILSRAFGAKDHRQFQKATAAMIILNTVITLLLTLAAILFLRPVMKLLNTPGDIFEQAYGYIFVILAGMLTTIFYNMSAAFLRSIGNSRTPLYFLILSCAMNLGLDVLFIIGMHTSVVGAAVATVIAEAASALLCWSYIQRNYGEFLPEKADYRLNRPLLCEMLSTGLSMALMLSVFSIGSIIMQRSINYLGTGIIGAHTTSRRIYEMLMMPLSTIATANSTFVSQNYGANRQDRIEETMKKIMILILIWSFFSLGVSFICGRFMVVLLTGTTNETLIANALLNLRLSTFFFFPLGVLLVLRTTMQSMGRKVAPVLSSSIELIMKIASCVILIPAVGYWGVAVTEPATWVICVIFLYAVYFVGNRNVLEHSGWKGKHLYAKN